ncbi:MAG: tetraacyldisaccharide 4'-kinase [Myxococcaceae bacterium]|nr:tetraacyldisaccharide 4'-kinase [Myxococcaceae bacterium]
MERLWYPPRPDPPSDRLLHLPLSLAAAGFGALVGARNALYDRGVLRSHRVEGVRVISVGNIHVGGAGKTPATIFLANRLLAAGRRVAVLTRGYGRTSTRALVFDAGALPSAEVAGDEPLLIATRAPGVRVHVGADRVASAKRAKAEGAEVLLLDDGMQHRRLARDLDIAVIDEAVGLGNARLLPRGPLREPVRALERAGLIWLRESSVPAPLPAFRQPVVRARYEPTLLLSADGQAQPAASLRGQKVVALSGLARPGAFTRTLESLGAEVVASIAQEDHHAWTRGELESARRRADGAGALLVTTEKDAVKLPAHERPWVLRLEVELTWGAELLDRLLADAIDS